MRERDRKRLLKAAPGVTLELDAPLPATHFTVPDPPRVVVDFEGIDLTAALRERVARVRADDPHIAGVRIGHSRRLSPRGVPA
jgi:hypothetical protein